MAAAGATWHHRNGQDDASRSDFYLYSPCCNTWGFFYVKKNVNWRNFFFSFLLLTSMTVLSTVKTARIQQVVRSLMQLPPIAKHHRIIKRKTKENVSKSKQSSKGQTLLRCIYFKDLSILLLPQDSDSCSCLEAAIELSTLHTKILKLNAENVAWTHRRVSKIYFTSLYTICICNSFMNLHKQQQVMLAYSTTISAHHRQTLRLVLVWKKWPVEILQSCRPEKVAAQTLAQFSCLPESRLITSEPGNRSCVVRINNPERCETSDTVVSVLPPRAPTSGRKNIQYCQGQTETNLIISVQAQRMRSEETMRSIRFAVHGAERTPLTLVRTFDLNLQNLLTNSKIK